jgi:cytoskeleton protein RodZ
VSAPVEPESPEEASAQAPTVGSQLRDRRAERGVEFLKVSQALRIEVSLIQALEADRFDAFSAPVFAKGYLRRYAEYLGLSPDDLVQRYHDQVGREEAPIIRPKRPIRLRDERQIALWIVAAVLFAALVVTAFLWWRTGEDPGPAALNSVTPLPEPVDSSAVEPAAPPQSALPMPPAPGSQRVAPEMVAATPAASIAAPVDAELAVTAETNAPPAALSVELEFAEDCWAEVTDANGARLFYGLGRPGARSRFSGVPPIAFLLGNVAGVTVKIDGQPYAVPRQSRQGNLARFVILESGA